jgi:hypothetical protein
VSFQGLSLKIDSLTTLYHNPRGTRIDQILLLLHLLLWFGPAAYLLGFSGEGPSSGQANPVLYTR